MVGGRVILFCFPFTKVIINRNFRRFLSAFSRAESFRFGWAMMIYRNTQPAGL
jgi:hypothetical protein